MKSLLLLIGLFVINWAGWHIFGKKGLCLLDRSPKLLFWACVEEALGTVSAFILIDVYVSGDWIWMALVVCSGVVGCVVGCLTSGVIRWKSECKY
jgi:hypothetical protein